MKFENIRNLIEKKQFLLLVLIAIFIGAFWRVFDINVFTGFASIEIETLKSAVQITTNHWQIDVHNIPNAAYQYLLAVFGHLTEFKPLYLRFLQAAIGIGTSIFFYLFVKSWFNKQVALLSTLFFATNAYLLILSRVIDASMLIILLQLVILYVLTIAFREKNIYLFALSGILSGLGFYLSPIFVVSGALIVVACLTITMKNRKIFLIYKYEFLALISGVLLTSGYFLFKLPIFFNEILSYFSPGSITSFYLNLGANVLAIFNNTPASSMFNVGTEPIVDPFIAVTFFAGVFYSLFHSNKRKYLFLLLWLLGTLAIISLTTTQGIGNLIILMPPIFIFSAVILDYILTTWTRSFPFNKSARLVMTFIFSLFLFLSIYYNFEKFFYGWQENEDVKALFTQELILE